MDVTERSFDGPHGPVPVRVYRAGRSGAGFVWSHGGGWIGGDLDMPEADAVARGVAEALDGVVVSVDYRLAPAHLWPVPLDDVVAAYDGTLRAAAGLDLDPARVGIGGASAGAHLTALAVGRVATPPRAVVLVYPATDPVDGPYDHRPDVCPPEYWLGRTTATGLLAQLLGHDGPAPDEAVPARVALAAMPPTLVTVAAVDGLRAQALRYAELLEAAGVPVTLHDVPELFHGYLNAVGISKRSGAALDRHAAWLVEALHP